MLLQGFSAFVDAEHRRQAIPGFVAYNLETAQGIVAAAERTGLPVLILAGSSAFHHAGQRELAGLCLDLARHAQVPVGVHLDHCRSVEEIDACLELGYTSVMFDGSHLPLRDNLRLTRDVVGRAHQAGAWVEAELVGTAGDEDVSTGAISGAMTDPEVARDFVQETGVDALAVAVGNVHGFTPTEPWIDLERLERIHELTQIPLVLHGASGLGAGTLTACIRRGIAKINVNTELRSAYLKAFASALPAALEKVDVTTPLAAARDAVADAAAEIIISLR